MDEKVAVVTGAASGIGRAVAARLEADGWSVLAADLEPDEHGPGSPLGADLTTREGNRDAVAAALERFGRLDAVFANAGFGAERGFERSTPEHWRAMVLTNVYGAALTIRATLPVLRRARGGHIVLTSSVAGRRPLPGSLYSATKFAVTAMGEALRQELRNDDLDAGIRVTIVEPGAVDTPFFDRRPDAAIEPADIAGAVLWALGQPPHVDVNEILVRPVRQPT
jgi:NADP-dependent 3-hydroxy acid dehydrogenase YdfG